MVLATPFRRAFNVEHGVEIARFNGNGTSTPGYC